MLGEEIRKPQILINAVRWNEAVKNAGCNPSIAAKNVSAANNGSNLIRAVTHANIIVPRFFAKSGGKPPVKGAGWPEKKIGIIGAGLTASKKLSSGSKTILKAASQRQTSCESAGFNRFQVGLHKKCFVRNYAVNIESKC